MSAITKLHTRKNKNSFWQHSSCPVQTQDYQTSLKTRNIFCLALKLTGQGEAAAPQLRTEPAPVVPVNAPLAPAARGIAAHTWCHKAQQSLDVVYSGKMGLLLPADHRGCCQELPQLSMDHFTGVTGKSNYKVSVFAELIEIPILSFFPHASISDSALHHKYFHHYSCPEDTALLQNIPRADPRNQWREFINSGFLRVTRLCVFSSGNPHEAMIKITIKLCFNN